MKKKKSDHVTPLLKHLHWLPVRWHIQYKILLLAFKALLALAPVYLGDVLELYRSTRALRFSDKLKLKAKLKSRGDRSFPVCAPKLCNGLPLHIRSYETVPSYEKAPKRTLPNVPVMFRCMLYLFGFFVFLLLSAYSFTLCGI